MRQNTRRASRREGAIFAAWRYVGPGSVGKIFGMTPFLIPVPCLPFVVKTRGGGKPVQCGDPLHKICRVEDGIGGGNSSWRALIGTANLFFVTAVRQGPNYVYMPSLARTNYNMPRHILLPDKNNKYIDILPEIVLDIILSH